MDGQLQRTGTGGDRGNRRRPLLWPANWPKGLGAKRVMPIPVSGAFHTPLMQGARGDLRKALAEVTFLTPEVRVVANVDAHVHDDPAEWPGLLSAQLCSPVRWRQTLETFAGLGLTSLVELGPGGVSEWPGQAQSS